jgi:hypothetical protein
MTPDENVHDLIAQYDADTLADPLVAFEQAIDYLRDRLPPAPWPGNPHVTPADDDARTGETNLVYVTFRWSTDYGQCYECAAPAGWVVWPYRDKRAKRMCAVCACNHAADGYPDPPVNIAMHVDEYGHAPDEDEPAGVTS